MRELGSQTGALTGHWLFASHPHRWLATRHTGALPAQTDALVSEHSTQTPPEHAGAVEDGHESVLPDALSPLQDSHTPVDPLQTGAEAGHSALLEHPHVPVATSHVGVVAPHALVFVAEHWAQAPDDRQAGAFANGQGREAVDPLSPLQTSQTFVARSHTGSVAGQLELASQPHVLLLVLHVG